MVTGVEVAGLVLGVIPLLISALENYEKLAAPTKDFFRWRRHVRRLIRELYTINISYDQAVRVLLKAADVADQTTMMEDPRSELWRKGDIADGLRDRLGSVYDPLILTIEEVSEILVEIAACLDIPGSQQVRALSWKVGFHKQRPPADCRFQSADREHFVPSQRFRIRKEDQVYHEEKSREGCARSFGDLYKTD